MVSTNGLNPVQTTGNTTQTPQTQDNQNTAPAITLGSQNAIQTDTASFSVIPGSTSNTNSTLNTSSSSSQQVLQALETALASLTEILQNLIAKKAGQQPTVSSTISQPVATSTTATTDPAVATPPATDPSIPTGVAPVTLPPDTTSTAATTTDPSVSPLANDPSIPSGLTPLTSTTDPSASPLATDPNIPSGSTPSTNNSQPSQSTDPTQIPRVTLLPPTGQLYLNNPNPDIPDPGTGAASIGITADGTYQYHAVGQTAGYNQAKALAGDSSPQAEGLVAGNGQSSFDLQNALNPNSNSDQMTLALDQLQGPRDNNYFPGVNDFNSNVTFNKNPDGTTTFAFHGTTTNRIATDPPSIDVAPTVIPAVPSDNDLKHWQVTGADGNGITYKGPDGTLCEVGKSADGKSSYKKITPAGSNVNAIYNYANGQLTSTKIQVNQDYNAKLFVTFGADGTVSDIETIGQDGRDLHWNTTPVPVSIPPVAIAAADTYLKPAGTDPSAVTIIPPPGQ